MILEKTHSPHLNTVPFLSPHTMLVTFIVLYYKWMVVFFTATKMHTTPYQKLDDLKSIKIETQKNRACS